MGKAQSKRSVDITTEVNKEGDVVVEGTGTLGKIEDGDQLKPQLNGDANHKEGDVSEMNLKLLTRIKYDLINCGCSLQ